MLPAFHISVYADSLLIILLKSHFQGWASPKIRERKGASGFWFVDPQKAN
jgi:hypothetical protein